MSAVVKTSGGSEKVTIDGVKVKNKINLKSYIFDPKMSTLPYDFYRGSSVFFNGEVHILGGNDNNRNHYKWDGETWTSVSTLPYEFIYGNAVVYNNQIHILSSGSSASSGNYTAHYAWNGTTWTRVSTLPVNLYGGCAVVFRGKIHILGGYNGMQTHYSWDGSTWSPETNVPISMSGGAAVVLNDAIHILIERNHYTLVGETWTQNEPLTNKFYYGKAIVVDDAIHLLGGSVAPVGHFVIKNNVYETENNLPYEFSEGDAYTDGKNVYILGSSVNTNVRRNHYGVRVTFYKEV